MLYILLKIIPRHYDPLSYLFALFIYLICTCTCLFSSLFIISTDVSGPQDLDPVADATYIRGNLTYMPSNPKELPIETEDVLHVNDEVKENM